MQTELMLKSDRPSASRQLGFISTGQPPKLTIRDDSGADNLLRCDPPSPANREIYRKIATALDAAGAHDDARLISHSLAKAKSDARGASAPAEPAWTVTVVRSWLYERPSVGSNRHGYLIRGDHVAVTQQENPDWAKIRYVHDGHPPLEAWLKRQDITR